MPATSHLLSRAGAQLASRGSIALRGALPTTRGADFAARTPSLAALARYYASKSYPSHTVISMPALSPTMTAGNVGAWQKKVGDSIAPGDVLVEIETDKAQMDFEFQEEGTVAKILCDAGTKDVAVGSPIAVLVEEGEDVSAFESFSIDDAGGAKKPDTPSKQGDASEASEPADSGSKTAPPSNEEPAPAATESDSTGARLQTALQRQSSASPAVKKLALEKGVPLGSIKGSGKGGAITKEDIENYKPTGGAPAAAGATSSAASYEDTEATSMRKVIATRLTESMQQNPHYFVASSISVSKMLKLREALNASADGKYKLSVNDLLVKALGVAARKVPAANSSWREIDGKVIIRQHNVVDVSVAVSTPIGLMTPIVKNVNSLGLSAVSSQIKDLGKRARDGKLKPEEYQGGTITISNMGMNAAVERFTAVINPPQACIVAIGTTKKVAVPGEPTEDGTASIEWDDQIVITGSFDHKVVDGAVGGEFMKELKKVIESPLELML
ncbi:dihydrolipoamide acetyltransferase component of pyruvate dehydrogenase [Dothidotthia symphoricarpi CBS 119687]|uniref:Acetyltransferase component of pyruvate dehydrogenase complex n=1 Tax=Dothidotthia symphoricarpi CBS 119687 TaxID=1392245 RepID=A0A6A6A9B9_9PLEO|nr:dihydrolipoamide acetyltransferase component of pyruvate dehydrogenase [Dothidotthia symphoricarpi CBS 119687]KAF2127775.1 dihydrolipoamide acetyltransferase component of pyruvate dehydrogenase [Dothidotthia symphoricarpi CBS 119687]